MKRRFFTISDFKLNMPRAKAPIRFDQRPAKMARANSEALRRGRVEDIFNRLVSIPALLCHPRFELELLLNHQTSFASTATAVGSGAAAGSSSGADSSRSRIASASPARTMPPACFLLPALFDTAQLAEAAAIDRRLAQQMTYASERWASYTRLESVATQSSTYRPRPPSLAWRAAREHLTSATA